MCPMSVCLPICLHVCLSLVHVDQERALKCRRGRCPPSHRDCYIQRGAKDCWAVSRAQLPRKVPQSSSWVHEQTQDENAHPNQDLHSRISASTLPDGGQTRIKFVPAVKTSPSSALFSATAAFPRPKPPGSREMEVPRADSSNRATITTALSNARALRAAYAEVVRREKPPVQLQNNPSF